MEFSKMELSPEDIRKDKDKKISRGFKLKLYFKDFCKKCNPITTPIANLCPACVAEMGPATLNQWKSVTAIMNRHDFPTLEKGAELVPFDEPDKM